MSDQRASQWKSLVDAHRYFRHELVDFVRDWDESSERIVKAGLGSEIRVALAVIRTLPADRAIRLLPDLLYHARSVHGHLEAVRETVLSISRDRLLKEIETAAQPLLATGDDEDYRRFLELYLMIDSQLALRLARTAANASDANIRDVGEDFLEKLVK